MRYEDCQGIELSPEFFALKERFGLSEKAAFLMYRLFAAGLLYGLAPSSGISPEEAKHELDPFIDEIAEYMAALEEEVADGRAD